MSVLLDVSSPRANICRDAQANASALIVERSDRRVPVPLVRLDILA